MAGLIKNQILKHLSKFAKNLSHDQINLSTLKGEGELRNLELNEEVLTDLLELPSWLKLSHATCNRVFVRIQWTKLKSVPIQLSLDEVKVEVETCEELRCSSGAQNKLPAYVSGGNYGFSDEVVDGIAVTINSVILTLKSRVFIASFQMSRIVLESKAPTWQKADLRMTRVKDTDRGEILIFKELSWQTVRIEAKSTKNSDLTPLRLITNHARCRITIKKKMSDCSVLGCRLVLILDDLLWVLTDDQLKAALHFADSLSGLVKRATEATQKLKGARKLESFAESRGQDKDGFAKKKTSEANVAAKVFARYDVVETSYHFYSDRIDLHLCDDPGGKGRSSHPQLKDGGAFQISLSQLQIDFYPYHLAISDRTAWIRYTDTVHTSWLDSSLSQFQSTLMDTLTSAKYHAPLSRASPIQSPNPPQQGSNESSNVRSVILAQFRKLMTSNLIVRLFNFSMWRVSTSKGKISPKEFVTGDRERFSLPDDMPVFHFEYTQFYYPGDLDFPLPPPKMFAFINPLQVNVDPLTCLWLNAFALNLQQSVKLLSPEKSGPPYLDVKVEAIMLRVIYEASEDIKSQKDRPKSIQFQVSRVLVANFRSLETGSKADLARTLELFQESELFFGTNFPNFSTDFSIVCQKLMDHATGMRKNRNEFIFREDNRLKDEVVSPHSLQPPSTSSSSTANYDSLWAMMRKDLLWTDSKDVWYLYLDPVWADLHGTPATGGRPIPFIDAFPVSLWLYKETDSELSDSNKNAKMHVVCQVNSLISVQINHYQFLFLMRMLESLSEITTFLSQDVMQILGENDEGSMAFGFIAPQVDISLLMPSVSQSRDCIGGDFESSAPLDTISSSVYSMGDLNCDRTACPSPTSTISVPSTSDNSNLGVPSPSPTTISAPVSPSHLQSTLPLAESVPDLRIQKPQQQQQQQQQHQQPLPQIKTPNRRKPGGTSNGHLKTKDKLTSSLSNMFASLDSSLRGTTASSAVSDDDNVSIRSEGSSDSESFVVINQGDMGREAIDNALFAVHSKRTSPVEIAAEVTEMDVLDSNRTTPVPPPSASDSHPPSSSNNNQEKERKRDAVVSVATFHLGRLELAQQSKGTHTCIKLQAASLSGEECPAIPWEEFQSKFSQRSKCWSESTLQPPSTWVVKLRFSTSSPINPEKLLENSSMSLKEKISRSADAFVHLRAQNLPLQFYMSTLTGLIDLVEDEIIPTPIPMKIQVENIALHLIEDRPSPNITSPGSLPIDLAIPALTITRDKSGLFSIQPAEREDNKVDLYAKTKEQPSANVPQTSSTTMTKPPPPLMPPSVAITTSSSMTGNSTSRSIPATSMSHHLDLVRSGVASLETELHQRAALLTVDNNNLRTLLENANVELQSLRTKIYEQEIQSKRMAKQQQQLLALEKENKSIKQTLKYLQQELIKSGKKSAAAADHPPPSN